jgi:hypothetical protein
MNNEFKVHMLTEVGKQKAAFIAETLDICLNDLTKVCVQGREFSLVKTKLEEACFFAKKAMAQMPGNSE